jgi:hypothetical protein
VKVEMTLKEWLRRGRALFGEDMMTWEFVCPSCGHVQTANDFQQYKSLGAKPDSVRQNCIGRFTGTENGMGSGKSPCNYAAYGLFRLAPVVVVEDAGHKHECFGFNEGGDEGD